MTELYDWRFIHKIIMYPKFLFTFILSIVRLLTARYMQLCYQGYQQKEPTLYTLVPSRASNLSIQQLIHD